MKMKTLFIALLIFICSTNCFPQTLKALDEKYGFKDLKFETPLSSFEKTVLEKFDDQFNGYTYVVPPSYLKIGEYVLNNINCYFFENKLYNINVEVESGYSNQQGILSILEKAYGKPVKKVTTAGRTIESVYTWTGQKVKMTYDIFDSCETCVGTLDIVCIKLDNLAMEQFIKKSKEEEEKKLKNGVKDL